jgi:hypothetical protein
LIIWAVSHHDLSEHTGIKIDWNQFSSYLGGRNLLLSYLSAGLDVETVRNQERAHAQFLDFDSYGAVKLDCNDFQVGPNVRTRFLDHNGRIIPLDVDFDFVKVTLQKATKLEAFQRAKIVFFTPPLAEAAEKEFHPDELDRIWDSFSILAASVSAQYIRIQNLGRFQDTLFIDYSHLNACGANKVTEILAARIAAINDPPLSSVKSTTKTINN